MAGIFGDEINGRAEFFRELARAIRAVTRLLRRPNEGVLRSVQDQLQAIEAWTANGRTPSLDERNKPSLSLLMYREFQGSRDGDIVALNDVVAGVHNYFQFWPDDPTAADP